MGIVTRINMLVSDEAMSATGNSVQIGVNYIDSLPITVDVRLKWNIFVVSCCAVNT